MRKAGNTIFQKILDQTPPEVTRQLEKSVDILDRIRDLMDERGWNQRQLAEAMNKRESEISRYLTPGHNFTQKTLAKLEIALGATITATPDRLYERGVLRSVAVFQTNMTLRESSFAESSPEQSVHQRVQSIGQFTEEDSKELVEGGNYSFAMAS